MSHRRLTIWTCALALGAATMAAGCGSASNDESTAASPATSAAATAEKTKLVIGESVPQLSDPQLNASHEALVAQAKEDGNEVVTVDANVDPNKQLSDVQSLVDQKVDAIVVFPVVPEAMQPAFDAARKAGIPLIVRQTSTGGPYFTNLSNDLAAIGVALADRLADELGPGAKVAAITGPATADVFRIRDSAFIEQAKKRGLDVVAKASLRHVTPDESAAIVRTWKEKYGSDLKGIYETLGGLALADSAAFDDSFKPLLVTYGGTDEDNLAAVRDGRFFALSDSNDVVVGKAEAWAANMAGRDEGKLPETVSYANPIIDASNVEQVTPQDKQIATPMQFDVAESGGGATLEVTP